MASDVDVSRIEKRQHTVCGKVLEVLVVGQLHLMAQVDDIGQEVAIVQLVVDSVLYAAVQVDCQHALRACRHAAGTQRIAEPVVSDFVAQAAAAAQRVGVVAHIGEETVSGGIHLGSELSHFGVHHLTVLAEQGHRFDGESEHSLRALLVEPAHKTLLQPLEAFPVGSRPVGEAELAEKAVEIRLVVVRNVPKHSLIVACAGGLVERVDNLLEAVGDDLVEGAAFEAEVNHLVGAGVVVRTVVLANEVVEIHQELGRGAGSAEHTADHKDHIDKAAAERLQVGGCRRVAADGGRSAEQPGIHRDAGTVVGQRRLVVLVDKMVRQQLDIPVGQLLAVHRLDAVGQQATVEADEIRLRQFADQRSNILVLDVGVGIVLGPRGGVGSLAIVRQELHLLHRLAVLGVALAIEHKALGHVVVFFLHQGHFDLVLDFLDRDAVVDVEVRKDFGQGSKVNGVLHCVECLDYGIHNLVEREAFGAAVALGDCEDIATFH